MKKMISNSAKQLYRKLVLSYFFLMGIIVLVSALGIVYVSNKNATTTTQRFLERTSSFVSTMEKQSNEMAISVYFSNYGQKLINQDPEVQAKLRMLNDLQYTITQDSNIHSIFFYNAESDKLLLFGSQLMETTRQNYPDSETLEYLLSDATINTPVGVNVLNSTYLKTRTSVYSIVHHMVDGSALIVNLNADKLFSAYSNSLSPQNDDLFLILNKDNELLYSNVHIDQGQSHHLINELLQKAGKQLIVKVPGLGLFHISNYYPKEASWTIVALTHWNVVYSELLSMASMFCLVILIGLVLIDVINKQIVSVAVQPYFMIQNELDFSNSAEDPQLGMVVNEISNMRDSLKEHRAIKKASIKYAQRALLKKYILGRGQSTAEFYDEAARLELPFTENQPLLLLYVRWYYTNQTVVSAMKYDDTVQYAFSNVFDELCLELGGSLIVSLDEEYHVMLAIPGPNYTPDKLKVHLQKLHTFFLEHFSLAVFCGVSDVFFSPDQISEITQELTSRFFATQYFAPDIYCSFLSEQATVMISHNRFFFNESSKLKRAIYNGNQEECAKLLKAYFDTLRSLNYAAVVSSLSLFCAQLISIFEELSETYPSLINDQQFSHQVVTAPTFEKAQKIIMDMVVKNCDLIFNDKNVSQVKQINKILNDLHTMYADCNLSAKSLAAANHISVETLNRICNQQVGKPVMAYVKEIRLKKSCDLLNTTTLPVEVIAKRVGFENTKYFHTVFKTAYGTSPHRYRVMQTMVKEQNEE